MTGASKVVVVTGAEGFAGKNLVLRLAEVGRYKVRPITRASPLSEWAEALDVADAVVHFAGVNRPPDPGGYRGNFEAADTLAVSIERTGRPVPVILASSVKATEGTPYGESKKAAEDRMLALAERSDTPVAIYRLPNIFGKWCRPNYNSAIATFCHNVARDLPITI